MLADEIANCKKLPILYKGVEKVQKKIIAAQKFNLATDFALAADGITDNFQELEKIAPLVLGIWLYAITIWLFVH
jgi:hypothetical protein